MCQLNSWRTLEWVFQPLGPSPHFSEFIPWWGYSPFQGIPKKTQMKGCPFWVKRVLNLLIYQPLYLLHHSYHIDDEGPLTEASCLTHDIVLERASTDATKMKTKIKTKKLKKPKKNQKNLHIVEVWIQQRKENGSPFISLYFSRTYLINHLTNPF